MAERLLWARSLYKEYGRGGERCRAVNGVDLDIHRGEFLSIIGASGSGKSSLLSLLAGMAEATGGQVYYRRKRLSEMTDKEKSHYRGKRIGFVFQEGNLLEDMTVLQNAALPGYLYGRRKPADERAAGWLKELGLEREQSKYPSQLSGGQRQRAAVARALINGAEILFLDEPTGSLDEAAGEVLLALLVRLHEKGQTIVMVTHDMGAAARGENVLLIRDGAMSGMLELGSYERTQLERRKERIYEFVKEGEIGR